MQQVYELLAHFNFQGLALILLTVLTAGLIIWELLLVKYQPKFVSRLYEKLNFISNKKILKKSFKIGEIVKWCLYSNYAFNL